MTLEKSLIEVYFWPDSDFFLRWPDYIPESISVSTKRSGIGIKYSEVPELIYNLVKIAGIKSIPAEVLEEVKDKKYISFANEEYENFKELIDRTNKFKTKIWSAVSDSSIKDKIFCFAEKELKEKLPDCEYAGYIAPSAEFPEAHILTKKDMTYIAQEGNILRLNNEQTREILNKTLNHYGPVVSTVLNCFR